MSRGTEAFVVVNVLDSNYAKVQVAIPPTLCPGLMTLIGARKQQTEKRREPLQRRPHGARPWTYRFMARSFSG